MKMDEQSVYFLNGLTGQFPGFDVVIILLASGLPYVMVATYFLFLHFSSYSRIEKLQIFWLTVISGAVARFGVNEIVQLFYHRPRPFITYRLHPLLVDDGWSFPSGHATFFFATATLIYLYNKKWGIGFFIATLVATISRVAAGLHYPSDILGGMIIGIFTAYGVFQLAARRRESSRSRAAAGALATGSSQARKPLPGDPFS
jgi:undecaprenyl-diphosphatase